MGDDPTGPAAGRPAAEQPVLYLQQEALFTWEQHAPGGCRCVCRLYHGALGACLAAAEPGHLIRVVVSAGAWGPVDISEPLPVCASCYTAIAPLADQSR